eukprot:364355-Chlamydomonas_euryale.AAC.1
MSVAPPPLPPPPPLSSAAGPPLARASAAVAAAAPIATPASGCITSGASLAASSSSAPVSCGEQTVNPGQSGSEPEWIHRRIGYVKWSAWLREPKALALTSRSSHAAPTVAAADKGAKSV